MPLAGILSGQEQRSNADFRLYLLTFTKAATVCDSTVILETIPSVIFEKRHICQCGSYPFTDCWGLNHENRLDRTPAKSITNLQLNFLDHIRPLK